MLERLQQFWSQPTLSYRKIDSDVRGTDLEDERRLQRTIDSLRKWIFLLAVLFSLTVVALATNIALQHADLTSRKLPVPRFPTTKLTFEQNDLFSGTSTSEGDIAWASIMPPGNGFVLVENPAAFGLEEGMSIKDVTGQMFDIAVFHQLHCLTRIREYLWHLKFAVDKNMTEQIRPILLDPQEDHVGHCFDYLRQSLMCSGDTTLEWPRVEPDGRRSVVDGWGITHQCVDWDAILAHARANTYPPAAS